MAFSVGSTRFVVSSSPHTAREILNSSAFADRPEMIEKIAGENGEVEVRGVLHFGAPKNVMMSEFGKWDGRMELEGLVREGYEVLGMINWSDHFPVLGWMDLQGVRRRSRDLGERVGVFVGKIVKEHRIIKRDVHNQCCLHVL